MKIKHLPWMALGTLSLAMTAMAAGKHVYVEKPVCHNLIEGQKLMAAALKAEKKGLIVQHGQQRRSDLGWAAAMQWVKEGHIGKVTLSIAAQAVSNDRSAVPCRA